MHVELDHLFVCVSAGAPEAQGLIDFGLSEGEPNRHPGQGTANRRFFFHNAFLELLWVVDAAEAQGQPVERTRLWDRWSGRAGGASPFGIGLRPSSRHPAQDVPLPPFSTWEYRPPYLPDPLAIHMGTNSQLPAEPLVFYLTFGRRPDSDPIDRRQPLDHPSGLRAMTRVRIGKVAHQTASAELRAIERACPWLSFAAGGVDVAEIGFDGQRAGRTHDFRPALPLVFHW